MDKVNLNKIRIEKYDIVKNENGIILKILNSKQSNLKFYKDAYFSFVKFNKIKGWKKHKRMTMTLMVPVGKVKFVFFIKDKFKSIIISENKFLKIIVPPNIWFAFKGISKGKNVVFNLANLKHNDKEILRKEINEIKYNWGKK